MKPVNRVKKILLSALLIGYCLPSGSQTHTQPNTQQLAPTNTPLLTAKAKAHLLETPIKSSINAHSIRYQALTDAQKQQQRFIYHKALTAIEQKALDQAQVYLGQLSDYPLKGYLEYALLRPQLTALPLAAIDNFLDEYAPSRLADKLTGRLLTELAQQQQWALFNQYYTPRFNSTPMRCRSLLARFYTQDQTALNEATALWNVGRSQPKACDRLFKALKDAKKITQSLRWSRFDKAIQSNEMSLARFLQRGMDAQHRQLADEYLRVHNNPKQVTQKSLFQNTAPQMQAIIAHGVRRLARKAPLLAWQTWEKHEAQRLFDAELATQTKQDIVKYLTRNGYLHDAERLLSYSHSLRTPSLVENLIRENLETLDWAAVAKNIALLPQELQTTDRWTYWSARSHDMLATPHVNTTKLYQKLAAKRSWYGFLAADLLDSPYVLEDATTQANASLKTALAHLPVLQRAQELWLTGSQNQARAEWYYALQTLNNQELLAAGELAKDWGWYNSGIVAMIKGNLWDHLTLRFPLAFDEQVAQASANNQLEPTLIFAVARQESAFAANAKSHAGARGLMQLMPATAKEQAKKSGRPNHTTQDLYTPEHNIALGSAYLSKLLNEFGGNRVLATAAYNAGKTRVKRWLKSPRAVTPADVWVEIIPFRETRQYVQNVLTYSVIYEYRLAAYQRSVGNPDKTHHSSDQTVKKLMQQPTQARQNGTLLRRQEEKINL